MCFSLAWFFSLLVWLVVVCAVVAILHILVPWLLGTLGVVDPSGGRVFAIIRIIIGAVILVWLIWVIYDLIMCLGPGFPRLGPGR